MGFHYGAALSSSVLPVVVLAVPAIVVFSLAGQFVVPSVYCCSQLYVLRCG